MQHSYEGLDRVGGFDRVRLFAPLAVRDYRLLVGGMSVSLLGDGLFLVALAWQVYALSNAPTALASVGIAMTIPTIVCLLIGGAVSDRHDRRLVMLCADAVRALALAALAVLSVSGSLQLWELMAVAVVYGAATAFFDPASDALVPELLPPDSLAQANSLDQLIRPLALRLAGPALGGMLVGAIGVGWAFGLDAASFVVSAATLLAMSPARRVADPAEATRSVRREVAAGLRYVRSQAWLWATLVSAAIAYLLFMGPTEVLLPFIVKNRLSDGAGALGLVFAAGGLGSLLCAIVIGQRGLPRRSLTFMYIAWTLATLAIAGYGLADRLWGLMAASVAFNALETAGHDRLVHGEAASGPSAAAGARLQPGLAHLDRAAAGLLRHHRPGERGARRAHDADRRRRAGRGGDVRRAARPGGASDGRSRRSGAVGIGRGGGRRAARDRLSASRICDVLDEPGGAGAHA